MIFIKLDSSFSPYICYFLFSSFELVRVVLLLFYICKTLPKSLYYISNIRDFITHSISLSTWNISLYVDHGSFGDGLGRDLMRLWVQSGMIDTRSFKFSRVFGGTPNTMHMMHMTFNLMLSNRKIIDRPKRDWSPFYIAYQRCEHVRFILQQL